MSAATLAAPPRAPVTKLIDRLGAAGTWIAFSVIVLVIGVPLRSQLPCRGPRG